MDSDDLSALAGYLVREQMAPVIRFDRNREMINLVKIALNRQVGQTKPKGSNVWNRFVGRLILSGSWRQLVPEDDKWLV